jgi:NADH-quinone oxidoreductase subunit D
MIGGCRYDLDAALARRRRARGRIEAALPELWRCRGNPIFQERTRGVGVISKTWRCASASRDRRLRGSGIAHDVRTAVPYDAYDELTFDGHADRRRRRGALPGAHRRDRRLAELVRRSSPGFPGPIFSRKPLKNPRRRSSPRAEIYAAVESPRGELGFHIVSDGSARPYA